MTTDLTTYLATQPGRCQHGTHVSQRAFHVCPELVALINAETPLGAITPEEWDTFTHAIAEAVKSDGLVSQTDVRPRIQSIFHKHRGLCYRRAAHLGLLELVGKENSTDAAGGNTDKDQKVYRLRSAA